MNIFKSLFFILFIPLVIFTSCSSENFLKKEQRLSRDIFKILSSESVYAKYYDASFSTVPNGILTEEQIKRYIRSKDEYGEYFSRKEYESYKATLSAGYAGIGIRLFQKKNNKSIFCIPFNPKLQAMGMAKYDVLISVNNISVTAKNLYIVSSLIRGQKNTSLSIKIKKPSGKILSLNLVREQQHYRTVEYRYNKRMNSIKIIEFTEETANELADILVNLRIKAPIVIDLRDNTGGDLLSAIESADLFLKKGTYITSVKSMNNRIDYYALNKDYASKKKVILLQNKNTASASEVFIVGLTENYRAESIGSKSYGKGLVQKIVPLYHGGAILFSSGKWISPNGSYYNNKGVLPTSNLSLNQLIQEN